MSDLKAYFARNMSTSQGSDEEKACAALLFNDADIMMGDQRFNNLAALTYNSKSCAAIFNLIEKAISPTDNHWRTMYKALLLLHTIVLFGSELAIDKAVDLCKFVHPLRTYNSALVKKGFFGGGGGTDYGAPVRATASLVDDILLKDEHIRRARAEARAGANTLVPMGSTAEQINPQCGQSMSFGQGLTTSVGAGFGLEAVPGMYEGRPDRYFDNSQDLRNRATTGNSQLTRDALAPSLLDLVFEAPAANAAAALPQAEYLPALQRQQELERQLAEQQELLRRLQAQQQQMQQQPMPMAMGQPQGQPQGQASYYPPPQHPQHQQQAYGYPPQQQYQQQQQAMPMMGYAQQPQQQPSYGYPPAPQQQQQQQQQQMDLLGMGMGTYPPHQQQQQQPQGYGNMMPMMPSAQQPSQPPQQAQGYYPNMMMAPPPIPAAMPPQSPQQQHHHHMMMMPSGMPPPPPPPF